MIIYAVVCAIGFGVAIDFVRPVITAITTCAGIHCQQSLSPCNQHAQTKVVHPDRSKVCAWNDEACIDVKRCMHVCTTCSSFHYHQSLSPRNSHTDKGGPPKSCKGVCLKWWDLYRCKALHCMYVCMHASICEWVSMHLFVWLALGLSSILSNPLSQWSPRSACIQGQTLHSRAQTLN